MRHPRGVGIAVYLWPLLALVLVVGVVARASSGAPRIAHAAAPTLPLGELTDRDTLSFDFYRARIEPILLRDRGGFGPGVSACVTCHVRSATPMPLEPLNVAPDGSVFWTLEQSRRNFANLAKLVVPGSPERSRLLREPLAVDAGGSEHHSGGKFWASTDDPEWRLLAEWVGAANAPPVGIEPSPVLDFEFFRNCVQKVFLHERPGLAPCASCHSSGAMNFAQTLPEGRSFWNEEESWQNFRVASRYIEPGDPLRSRLLMHPLHPDAGGDGYHAGGRRWATREDPEWRLLAAWVSGESPTCVL